VRHIENIFVCEYIRDLQHTLPIICGSTEPKENIVILTRSVWCFLFTPGVFFVFFTLSYFNAFTPDENSASVAFTNGMS